MPRIWMKMNRLSALLLAAGALLVGGCNWWDPYGYQDCRAYGGLGWTWVIDDPENCGWCEVRCGEGVPCVDSECQANSVMNCGEAGRQCVAVDGQDVVCVRFFNGDAAVGDAGPPPDGVELVNGFGCVPIGRAGDAGVGDAGVGDAGAEGQAKRLDPRWVLIPGHTPACEDGLDTNGCVTGDVALTDLCGAPITEPFAYDFTIMTEEMSRAQYRERMCDCTAPRFARCRTLCEEGDAPDAAKRDALPMTGLNWCEAYAACRAWDARLPTARERARLESMAGAPETLFGESLSCGAWVESTGGVPWLAECLEGAAADLDYDTVKGESGRLYIGQGVLSEPEPVRHLLGNVNEWAADPAASLVSRASGEAPSFWGVPQDAAEAAQPRILRGRSLFSPAGERGDRLLAVDPSLRSKDIGLRCARTTRSPFDEPVPYDDTLLAEDFARCEEEQVALRPVRRTIGEQVYRATGVCLDREVPRDMRIKLEALGRSLLLGPDGGSAFSRRVSAGTIEAAGIARFAGDEQWWWSEPVEEPRQDLAFALGNELTVWMTWQGEDEPELSRCAEGSGSSLLDGKVVRQHTFAIDQDHLWLLGFDGPDTACAHLDCANPTISHAACPVDCPGWVLPFAITFERVEPYSPRQLCP